MERPFGVGVSKSGISLSNELSGKQEECTLTETYKKFFNQEKTVKGIGIGSYQTIWAAKKTTLVALVQAVQWRRGNWNQIAEECMGDNEMQIPVDHYFDKFYWKKME